MTNWAIEKDTDIGFRADCHRAATSDTDFVAFRSMHFISGVVENTPRTEEMGNHLLDRAAILWPPIQDHLQVLARNDTAGTDYTIEYRPGVRLTATTCRYARQISQLACLFTPQPGWKIAEIGGGYGGFAAIMCGIFSPANYTIFDIPEALELQKKYLDTIGVPGVEFIDADQQLPSAREYDFVISACALSELAAHAREEYAAEVLSHAKRGLLWWNEPGTTEALAIENGQEWLYTALDRFVSIRPGQALLYWGNDKQPGKIP